VCSATLYRIKENGIKSRQEKWYEHVLKSVKASHESKATILRNQQLKADRTIPKNKPDIIIRDNIKDTYQFKDSASSGGRYYD
jgi:hypothetical protein